ncbi:MAG: thiamine biosynthesis protein ThiS [Desulfobulbus propionicus]|nr:MAG: thiamine biosynthesis protein ThiS [Desulfobulbus propionicus]
MNIQINGQQQASQAATLGALIADLGLEKKSLVVEYNGAIVKQEAWDATRLSDGDTLELLNFVGGG